MGMGLVGSKPWWPFRLVFYFPCYCLGIDWAFQNLLFYLCFSFLVFFYFLSFPCSIVMNALVLIIILTKGWLSFRNQSVSTFKEFIGSFCLHLMEDITLLIVIQYSSLACLVCIGIFSQPFTENWHWNSLAISHGTSSIEIFFTLEILLAFHFGSACPHFSSFFCKCFWLLWFHQSCSSNLSS